MDATLYLQFSSPAARQACLYYFDPQTTLPFADEVEEAEARLIEAVEQLPCADAITLSGDSAAYLDLQLDEDEWEAELDGLREFIRGFAPTQLYLYVDTLNEYAAVLRGRPRRSGSRSISSVTMRRSMTSCMRWQIPRRAGTNAWPMCWPSLANEMTIRTKGDTCFSTRSAARQLLCPEPRHPVSHLR